MIKAFINELELDLRTRISTTHIFTRKLTTITPRYQKDYYENFRVFINEVNDGKIEEASIGAITYDYLIKRIYEFALKDEKRLQAFCFLLAKTLCREGALDIVEKKGAISENPPVAVSEFATQLLHFSPEKDVATYNFICNHLYLAFVEIYKNNQSTSFYLMNFNFFKHILAETHLSSRFVVNQDFFAKVDKRNNPLIDFYKDTETLELSEIGKEVMTEYQAYLVEATAAKYAGAGSGAGSEADLEPALKSPTKTPQKDKPSKKRTRGLAESNLRYNPDMTEKEIGATFCLTQLKDPLEKNDVLCAHFLMGLKDKKPRLQESASITSSKEEMSTAKSEDYISLPQLPVTGDGGSSETEVDEVDKTVSHEMPL
jgi:hypothetical protein